jgi:hypothetical protein
MYVPFCVFCFIVLFCVLFVCKCVLDCCHRDIGALFDYVMYVVMYVPFCVFCVLFVRKCVLYCCHRVSTQLQLNNKETNCIEKEHGNQLPVLAVLSSFAAHQNRHVEFHYTTTTQWSQVYEVWLETVISVWILKLYIPDMWVKIWRRPAVTAVQCTKI